MSWQDSLIKLLLAVSQGHGHDAAAVAIALGTKLEGYDGLRFEREASELIVGSHGATVGDLQAGAVIGALARISGDCALRLPPELTMLGKALLNLDEVARTLDPAFDPNAAIERQGSDLMRRKLAQTATPANIFCSSRGMPSFSNVLRTSGSTSSMLARIFLGLGAE